MHHSVYLTHVRERLLTLGYAPVEPPPALSPHLPVALERQEEWGRLLIAVAARPRNGQALQPHEVVRETASWVRGLTAGEADPSYLILVFPFAQQVPDDLSDAIRALREEDPGRRWGVIPWVVDLEAELVDRHTGFPAVGDEVARFLTEAPRAEAPSRFRPAPGTRPLRRSAPESFLGIRVDEVPVTRTILAITVAFYLWTVLVDGGGFDVVGGPGRETVITWGANYTVSVLVLRQQWRLLSHVLLHGGLIHLGFNMWALWNLGRHVEMLYGSGRMLFIYLVAGVAGGIASVAIRPAEVLSIGASGAIMGLMGALLYFGKAMGGRQVNWQALSTPVVIVLLYGLIIPRIDNYAHIGGLVGGALAAFLAGLPGERKRWRDVAMAVTGVVILALLLGLVPLPSVFRPQM